MSTAQVTKKVLSITLLSCAVLAAAGSYAQAQRTEAYRRPVSSGLPKLGFYGHIVYGQGLMIDNVAWATEAQRIGLEPGDVIVSVNGRPIRNWNDYNSALYYSGGYGRLVVRDRWTGRYVTTNFVLNNGRGRSAFGKVDNR